MEGGETLRRLDTENFSVYNLILRTIRFAQIATQKKNFLLCVFKMDYTTFSAELETEVSDRN